MVATGLALAGCMSIVTGVAFILVARAVARRATPGDGALANFAHGVWWGGMGIYLLIQGTLTVVASADALDARMYATSRFFAIPLLCGATWGITFYLVYLYRGTGGAARPLAAFFAGVGALFFYATFSAPLELVIKDWLITVNDTSLPYRLVYLLVGVPPIVASFAYLGLLRHVRSPEKRYRIVLVAGSILLYVGSGLAARLLANDAIIFLTLVLLGLASAIGALAAYHPPAAIRRRLQEGSV